ncbi:unnamed protein product [Jaminaea pallidilutea]
MGFSVRDLGPIFHEGVVMNSTFRTAEMPHKRQSNGSGAGDARRLSARIMSPRTMRPESSLAMAQDYVEQKFFGQHRLSADLRLATDTDAVKTVAGPGSAALPLRLATPPMVPTIVTPELAPESAHASLRPSGTDYVRRSGVHHLQDSSDGRGADAGYQDLRPQSDENDELRVLSPATMSEIETVHTVHRGRAWRRHAARTLLPPAVLPDHLVVPSVRKVASLGLLQSKSKVDGACNGCEKESRSPKKSSAANKAQAIWHNESKDQGNPNGNGKGTRSKRVSQEAVRMRDFETMRETLRLAQEFRNSGLISNGVGGGGGGGVKRLDNSRTAHAVLSAEWARSQSGLAAASEPARARTISDLCATHKKGNDESRESGGVCQGDKEVARRPRTTESVKTTAYDRHGRPLLPEGERQRRPSTAVPTEGVEVI